MWVDLYLWIMLGVYLAIMFILALELLGYMPKERYDKKLATLTPHDSLGDYLQFVVGVALVSPFWPVLILLAIGRGVNVIQQKNLKKWS